MSEEVHGAIGLLERPGEVYLVANWRELDGRRELCWDLPGGGVEPGESLEETVVREMAEETGRAVRVRDLLFVVERFGFRGDPRERRSRFFFFAVEEAGPPGPVLCPKIVDHGFKPLAELRAYCSRFYHREMHEWFDGGRQRRYFVTRF